MFRLKRPKTCLLLFRTGRMVCVGANSEKEARRAVAIGARELKKAGIIITGKPEVRIENIVASGSLGRRIDLEELCKRASVGGNLMYEPEQFPGAIYRMKSPHIVLLLFSSCEIVIVGAKKEEEVYEGAKKLQRELEELGVIYTETV